MSFLASDARSGIRHHGGDVVFCQTLTLHRVGARAAARRQAAAESPDGSPIRGAGGPQSVEGDATDELPAPAAGFRVTVPEVHERPFLASPSKGTSTKRERPTRFPERPSWALSPRLDGPPLPPTSVAALSSMPDLAWFPGSLGSCGSCPACLVGCFGVSRRRHLSPSTTLTTNGNEASANRRHVAQSCL